MINESINGLSFSIPITAYRNETVGLVNICYDWCKSQAQVVCHNAVMSTDILLVLAAIILIVRKIIIIYTHEDKYRLDEISLLLLVGYIIIKVFRYDLIR